MVQTNRIPTLPPSPLRWDQFHLERAPVSGLPVFQDVRYLKPYLEEVRKENREKAEWSKK